MTRSRAFEVPILWAGRVETLPGAVSGWHHHDRNETSLYVVSGVLRLEFEGYDGDVDAEAGDFVHVPPFTVHRESNPTDRVSVAAIAPAPPPPPAGRARRARGRSTRWQGPAPAGGRAGRRAGSSPPPGTRSAASFPWAAR